jgi:hypothetical protein
LFTVVIQLIGLLSVTRFIMLIIHPFHRISEDARHCSALSYRQVADCDCRVPEVIDRLSFLVANLDLVVVPLLSAVLDCSLEAPATNLAEVSSDSMCDPKEDISSDPTCDPKEESFTRLGKRDSLPRIPRYRCQSNQATMPYNKTLSNRQQRPTKKTVADDLSHPIQGPQSDRRGRHGLNGPRYRHARAVSLERTSASSVSRFSPFRSYFHVESILAAGIERLTSESTSMFCFAITNRRTSGIRTSGICRSTISSVKACRDFDRCLELELRERLTDCQHETRSRGIELANLFCHPTAFANAVGTTSAPPDSPPAPVDASRDPGLDPTRTSDDPEDAHLANITDDPSLHEVEDITPIVEPAIDVPVLPAVVPTVYFASDVQGGVRFGLSQLAIMLSPTRHTVPTTTAEMPQLAFSKKSPVLAKPRPLPLGLTPSTGVSPISAGEPSVVLTLQAALAAQLSQLDQVLNKLAIQQACMTPTIADTITDNVDLSALTAQAALSSQALVDLLKRTSVSSSPGNHGNSSESSDSS